MYANIAHSLNIYVRYCNTTIPPNTKQYTNYKNNVENGIDFTVVCRKIYHLDYYRDGASELGISSSYICELINLDTEWFEHGIEWNINRGIKHYIFGKNVTNIEYAPDQIKLIFNIDKEIT